MADPLPIVTSGLAAQKMVIAYRPEAIAPHQGMFVDFMATQAGPETRLVIRPLPTSTLARLAFFVRVAMDALFYRNALLYFGSFLSVAYAIVPIVLLHRKWVYHSQDWITDGPGLPAKLEPLVVKRAPVVLWNEPNRAAKAREESGRKQDILILPTYLPSDYPVPPVSDRIRAEIASKAGASIDKLVIVFAGGGYSKARLSDQLLEAMQGQDPDVVLVFTGVTRTPERLKHPKVVDCGMLDYDEMVETMASSDIGMLLYDYENSFGNRHQQPGRLTEYTKGGLAMIATPFLDSNRLADETNFCITVKGYSVPELSDAISEMVARIRSGAVEKPQIAEFASRELAYERFASEALTGVLEQLS